MRKTNFILFLLLLAFAMPSMSQKIKKAGNEAAESNFALGQDNFKQEKFKEALTFYKKAMQMGKKDIELYNAMGDFYFELERNYEVITC